MAAKCWCGRDAVSNGLCVVHIGWPQVNPLIRGC